MCNFILGFYSHLTLQPVLRVKVQQSSSPQSGAKVSKSSTVQFNGGNYAALHDSFKLAWEIQALWTTYFWTVCFTTSILFAVSQPTQVPSLHFIPFLASLILTYSCPLSQLLRQNMRKSSLPCYFCLSDPPPPPSPFLHSFSLASSRLLVW